MSRRMRCPSAPALAGRLAVLVRVVVMARGGVAEPREARQALALGQHVAGDARLSGRQGIGEQIALELGDARPVLHIEILVPAA